MFEYLGQIIINNIRNDFFKYNPRTEFESNEHAPLSVCFTSQSGLKLGLSGWKLTLKMGLSIFWVYI
jgi:hypothetical protein